MATSSADNSIDVSNVKSFEALMDCKLLAFKLQEVQIQ